MSVFANLNANAAAGDKFSSSVEVVDSIGKSHVVTMTFTKGRRRRWTMQASIPGEETSASGATAGTPFNLLTTPTDVKFDTTRKDDHSRRSRAASISAAIARKRSGRSQWR